MIDDSVINVFKATLTDLLKSPQKAMGFQITVVSENSKGKVNIFLVQDDEVSQRLLDYFDYLSRDHGGRKPHDVDVKHGTLSSDN